MKARAWAIAAVGLTLGAVACAVQRWEWVGAVVLAAGGIAWTGAWVAAWRAPDTPRVMRRGLVCAAVGVGLAIVAPWSVGVVGAWAILPLLAGLMLICLSGNSLAYTLTDERPGRRLDWKWHLGFLAVCLAGWAFLVGAWVVAKLTGWERLLGSGGG